MKHEYTFKDTVEQMRNVKALFFDIDGTLVSFNTHRIPGSTVQALRTAKQRGVMVFISTGRPIHIINNLGQIEELIDGYITTNGAYCFIGKEQVCMNAISKAEVAIIMDACRQWDRPIVMSGKDEVAIFNYKQEVDDVFNKQLGVNCIDYGLPAERLLGKPILQMTPFISYSQEEELMAQLPGCTSGRWSPHFTDITCSKADKGKGLAAMALHLGLNICDTMAFGDGGNDTPILRAAGIGVAMGNGCDEAKENADFVTESVDEDGVRNALHHFGVI